MKRFKKTLENPYSLSHKGEAWNKIIFGIKQAVFATNSCSVCGLQLGGFRNFPTGGGSAR